MQTKTWSSILVLLWFDESFITERDKYIKYPKEFFLFYAMANKYTSIYYIITLQVKASWSHLCLASDSCDVGLDDLHVMVLLGHFNPVIQYVSCH